MPTKATDESSKAVETDMSLRRKIVRFEDLKTCGEEVWIEHEGKLYRLQSTRQGKLVLTK